MNIKNLLIITLFSEINNINSRVYKIYKAFSSDTTIVTPNFDHGSKKYKSKSKFNNDSKLKIDFLSVISYNKNISIKRIVSHVIFAIKLQKYLTNMNKKPDIVICLMPTSSAAYIAGKYCKRKKIMFVVDVIDLWPDSLIPLSKNIKFINIFIKPWTKLTNKAYKLADYISGESKYYSDAAREINNNVPHSYTYLGVDKKCIEQIIQSESNNNPRKQKGLIYLCYGGNLGNSYDFDDILNAIKVIQNNGIKYKMMFIGEGEKRRYIEKYTRNNNMNIEITGRLNYNNYIKILSICDIGFNSFKDGTKVVHSYKFNDYCACGLYIFNNLKGETSDIIEEYDVGINYKNKELSRKLLEVCEKWDFYQAKKSNLSRLINEKLDCDLIYGKMRENILKTKNMYDIKC